MSGSIGLSSIGDFSVGVGQNQPSAQSQSRRKPPAPASIADYTALITSEHAPRPKFVATVAALVAPLVAVQALLDDLPRVFDLDTAIGVQLDAVGQWVGRSRFITTPLPNTFFSLDVDGLGFDQGSWAGPFDSSQGITRLDDDTYRMLLYAVRAANNWDGTVEGAATALLDIFTNTTTPGTRLIVQDNFDMTMVFGFAGQQPSALFQALAVGGYIPLRPEGVAASYHIVTANGSPLFGFDTENSFISGFDVGAWGAPPGSSAIVTGGTGYVPPPVVTPPYSPPPTGSSPALDFSDPANSGYLLLL